MGGCGASSVYADPLYRKQNQLSQGSCYDFTIFCRHTLGESESVKHWDGFYIPPPRAELVYESQNQSSQEVGRGAGDAMVPPSSADSPWESQNQSMTNMSLMQEGGSRGSGGR